jgi:ribonuclease HII
MSLSRLDEYALKTPSTEVIGIDEAGRGPLAGPVVAAAVFIPSGKESFFEDLVIKDSKLTTEEERVSTYEALTKNPNIIWAVSVIDHAVIDKINILQATLEAMRDSCTKVFHAIESNGGKYTRKTLIALIDGNKIPSNMPIESKFVIKGDSIIYSIAAASIIAKVTRDRIMHTLDKTYPEYGFGKHKGYPTVDHRAALSLYGPSPVHRLSYRPVRECAERMRNKDTMSHRIENVDDPLRTPTRSKRTRDMEKASSQKANVEISPAARKLRYS